jgi:hypothetical protein
MATERLPWTPACAGVTRNYALIATIDLTNPQ